MPTNNEIEDLAQQHDVRTFLGERVILLATRLGYWKGIYQMPEERARVIVDNHDVKKDSVTTPRIKLMTANYPHDKHGVSWWSRFQKLHAKMERLKNSLSVKFAVAGVRLVPQRAAAEFMERLFGRTVNTVREEARRLRAAGEGYEASRLLESIEAYRHDKAGSTPLRALEGDEQSIAYDLHVMAEEFCDDWPNILKEITIAVPEIELVRNSIPKTAANLRRRFYIDASPVLLDSGRQDVVTASDLQEHIGVVQATCTRIAEQAVAEMVKEPRMKLCQALKQLKQTVEGEGRVTQRSFNGVREAMKKIELFRDVATPELLEQIAEIGELIPEDPKTLREAEADARAGFVASIDAVMNEIQDAQQMADAASRFMDDTRVIELWDEDETAAA